MRRYILPGLLVGCLITTACSPGTEAEKLTKPYNVETAKKTRLKLEPQFHQTTTARSLEGYADWTRYIEIAEAVASEEDETIESEGTTSEHEDSTSEPKEATSEPEDSTPEAVEVEQAVEQVVEPPVEMVEDSCFEEAIEYGTYYEDVEDVPEYGQETYEDGLQLLGCYYVTHYSAEACGNAIGAAEVPGGMVEGVSVAMPEHWMLGRWVYIEGYGEYRVDDISPDGIADIFHWSAADAVGADYRNVYLMG